MKITSIVIENFRGCPSLAMVLNGSAMLLGLNGSGKSSVLMAVQWALTGVVYDNRGQKMVLRRLLGPADKKTSVTIGIQTDQGFIYTLEATANAANSNVILYRGEEGASSSDRIVGTDAARMELFRACGFDIKHAHASAHAHAYVLSDDLYVRLNELGGSLDMAKLETFCGERWAALSAWVADIRFKWNGMKSLRTLGQTAYDERTGVNREIKRIEQHIQELPLPPADLDITKKDAVERRLATLRTERDGYVQAKALSENGRSADTIDAEKKRIAAELGAIKPIPDIRKMELKITANNEITEPLRVQISETNMQIAALKKELEAAQAGTCPTCKQVIPAKMAQDDKTARQLKITELEMLVQELSDKRFQALSDIQPTVNEITAAKQEAEKTRQKRANLEAELAALDREKPAAAFDPAKLAEVEDRIARGETMLQQINLETQRQKQLEDLRRYKGAQDLLSWVVENFRDGVAQAAMGADAQQQFLAAVNAVLDQHGYYMSLAQNDGNLVALLHSEGCPGGIAVTEVSHGELLVMQCAIGEALGVGFVVLDDVEAMDNDNRAAFFDRLAGGQQYLCAATWVKPEMPDANKIAAMAAKLGCDVFWLGDMGNEAAA